MASYQENNTYLNNFLKKGIATLVAIFNLKLKKH